MIIHTEQANTEERVEVTAAELPFHCPPPGKRLWDSHPKVYLPLEEGVSQKCPYCGTIYILNSAAV